MAATVGGPRSASAERRCFSLCSALIVMSLERSRRLSAYAAVMVRTSCHVQASHLMRRATHIGMPRRTSLDPTCSRAVSPYTSVLSYEMPHVGLHEQRALASDGNKQLETVLLFELSHKCKSLTRKTNHSFLT